MIKPIPSVAVQDGLGFDGWYFEDGYFCSPQGDRLSVLAIAATVMARQTEAVRDLMYWRPSQHFRDVVMHHYLDRPQPKHQVKRDYIIQVAGLRSDDCRPEPPL